MITDSAVIDRLRTWPTLAVLLASRFQAGGAR